MPSRTLQIDAPRLRSRISNRLILASRAKYFNKKNALSAIAYPAGSRIEPFDRLRVTA
jgi:hypothetical protein